ncbi:ATP-binding protein [Spirosoma foliorum]|uniref:ATP-binding protein n=1 Tax=Spirosoma foliorum TaxID=2710596 RepID=A0A7G5GML5_9BACT|nr:ATP-binding protein [Spirosoma foliorum]QMW00107.1 ATP-binding protein [Spirosoma foliorum]
MIDRAIITRVKENLTFFPIVSIIGPRQVGKTTLAKQLSGQLSKPTLYLDLELATDAQKLEDAQTYLQQNTSKCVILDEIQRMPHLFPLLRALVDQQREPARFVLLGSSSPDLIRESSESLAGRISYIELMPFSWPEVMFSGTMAMHWLKGGFPEAFLAPRLILTFRWLSSFVQTYIERDIRALGYELSGPILNKLLSMIAHINSSILNVSDLARSLGVSQPTVNRYLDLLEGSFVIHRLPPYFANVSKRLVKSPKLYLRDSGLLHQLAQVISYDVLLGHPVVGASWEGYVIEQTRRVVGTEWSFYYYRTAAGAEIDLLLIAPNGKKIAIEIKLSNAPTVSKGFYQSIADINPDYSFIVIPDGDSYPKADGLWVCNLTEFLIVRLPTIYSN